MSQNRILFTGGQVFDGTGAPPVPADVVVRGGRIESVRPGGGTPAEACDQVVDCAGATVMPGLVESHCHLTFPGMDAVFALFGSAGSWTRLDRGSGSGVTPGAIDTSTRWCGYW